MSPVASSAHSIVKVGHLDDVQELRKCRPTAIPERYVRETAERPTLTLAEASLSIQIPVIDLSKLAHGGQYQSQKELEKLSGACENWGFFQIVNHGIDSALLERMQRVTEEFFMLPLEEKEKYPMAPGTVQGYGHAFVFTEDQKLDWCNMLALGVEPSFIRNPKLWPTNPPKFRETLESYSANIRKLSQTLLRFIAMSLGLKPEKFNEMFGTAVQAVRMNYYPPCPRPDLVLGLSPHSDGSALTVLQQSMGSVGLQILKGNTWLPVLPICNALVINIGDTIEVLTNGRYKSVEHRAVTNKDKDRLSIVTFYAPSYEIELGPLTEFVNKKHPCMYRRYNHGEYSRHYINTKLEGKRSLEFAKIQNKSFS
ncbi:protein LATERAL BRANCHING OXIDOREDUCTASE 1 [Aristolochia californica]|uniref:protein LATERAL BRANCHING OXIDOREDUCTASE 1 n=1 Tax=Aristolochia californica TaxID=171875 RepID=UPI0035DCE73A